MLPHGTHVGGAVDESFQKRAGQSPVGSRHDAVALSHIVPLPQSANATGQIVAASAPAAAQQQRRGLAPWYAVHVEVDSWLK